MEKNMKLQDESHKAAQQRIKKESKKDNSVCDDQLERCEKNLEDEKKDAKKSLSSLQK